MAFVTCPCAFQLRKLAQTLCPDLGSRHLSCKFSHKMALVTCPCVSTAQARINCASRSWSLAIFPVNSRVTWLLWDVRVHFDCAGSHKVCATGGSPSSSGPAAFSPACQVKASRFYQGYFIPPAFSSSGSSSQPRAPDLGTARFDREVQSSAGTSGPQPRAPDLSGALPDLSCK